MNAATVLRDLCGLFIILNAVTSIYLLGKYVWDVLHR